MEPEKIKIHPDTDFEHARAETKKGQPLTNFTAVRVSDGKLLTTCQAWGDRVGQIKDWATGGAEIEVDLSWNGQYNRWDVKFPQAAGGGNKWGGRPWVPQGYKGQPVPFDRWVAVTRDVMVQMVSAIKDAATPLRAETLTADAVLAEARSLVAQYWMAVRDNVTFPPGYEPKADSTAAQAASAAAAGHPSASQIPAAAAPPPMNGVAGPYADLIGAAQTTAEVDVYVTQVRTDAALEPKAKADLQLLGLMRKKALTQGTQGAGASTRS